MQTGFQQPHIKILQVLLFCRTLFTRPKTNHKIIMARKKSQENITHCIENIAEEKDAGIVMRNIVDHVSHTICLLHKYRGTLPMEQ
jgi:hypothetical protein